MLTLEPDTLAPPRELEGVTYADRLDRAALLLTSGEPLPGIDPALRGDLASLLASHRRHTIITGYPDPAAVRVADAVCVLAVLHRARVTA